LQQDTFQKGDCDDSIVILSQLLGWHDELMELHEKTKVKPEKDGKSKKMKANKQSAQSRCLLASCKFHLHAGLAIVFLVGYEKDATRSSETYHIGSPVYIFL